MTLKKMIYLNTFITFILCFITHNVYEWIPMELVAVFFPVNESIWEHMKMLFTTIIIYSFIEYLLLLKFKILYSNLFLATLTKGILIIPIYLLLFLPFYIIIGDNFIIAIITMFIAILIVNFIGYNFLDDYKINNQFIYGIIGIIIMYIIFGYFTFNPPKKILFYDTSNNTYGIKK